MISSGSVVFFKMTTFSLRQFEAQKQGSHRRHHLWARLTAHLGKAPARQLGRCTDVSPLKANGTALAHRLEDRENVSARTW